MKNTLTALVYLQACGASLFLFAPAGFGQNSKFYVKGDVGGNLTPDIKLEEFFGPVAPDSKIKLEPGFRAGVSGGYQVTDWLAGEAEVGVMENRISSITGATQVHDATFANVPLLFNVKLQYPNSSRFVPYAGVGLGFSETIFNVDQVTIGNTSLSGDDAATVFAWQAFAGLRYQINERMGVCAEYRYFVAENPEWHADVTYGTSSNTLRFGRAQTHALSLAFEFRF